MKIVIVGGGAAGLMAALTAGRALRSAMPTGPANPQAPGGGTSAPSPEPGTITIVDGAANLGAKILVSGGGRCNVTHDVVLAEDYHGASTGVLHKVLRSFPVPQTVDFFRSIGVELKREDTGKLFPVSDQARTVLEALLNAVRQAGVTIQTSARVTGIAPHGDRAPRFTLATLQGDLVADRVILAAGGMSLPKTGSDGSGFALARGLGHSIVEPFPALAPLVLESGHWLTTLSGVSFPATLSVADGRGKVLHRQAGSLLCTHFGISGPVVLDISRHWSAAHRDDPAATLHMNVMGGMTFDELETWWQKQRKTDTVAAVLRGRLPQRLVQAVLREVGPVPLPGDTAVGQLPRDTRRMLSHALTALPLPVVRDRGWLFAEVTAGGVPMTEVETATMASRVCPGLHLCGEILNVDGRMGGYNFQWAWCTGRLAGLAAARNVCPRG